MKILDIYFIDSFPALIVEMTFSLLNLTLASPKLNKMISNSALLMKNLTFKVYGDKSEPGTRKYSKIDVFGVASCKFLDFPETLTEVTLDDCRLEPDNFHVLLSKVASTLKFLIVQDCVLYDSDLHYDTKNDSQTENTLQPLHFPTLKTLIIVNMFRKSL